MTNQLKLLFLLLNLALIPSTSYSEVIKIGVFSNQDFRATMAQWGSTAVYLKQQLPHHVFQILPYSRRVDLATDLQQNKLDFLLSQRSQTGQLVAEFSLKPLLSHQSGNQADWVLSNNHGLSTSITQSITDSLLQKNLENATSSDAWQVIDSHLIKLTQKQQLNRIYNESSPVVFGWLKDYSMFIVAILFSMLLILAHRKWEHYHLARTQAKKHRQQTLP